MLIELFEVLQISRLPPKYLPKLLFEFKEPFDKELAMKNWEYGGEADLDYKKLLFFYNVLFGYIIEYLETVFSPYINNQKEFIEPHPEIVKDFTALLQFFFLIQNHKLIWTTYRVDLTEFNPIDGDYQRLLMSWLRLRGKFLDHKAKINNFLLLNGITSYPLPYRLQRIDQAIKNNLSKQKEFQKTKILPINGLLLRFSRKNSHKSLVFQYLEKHINNWVHKKDIKRFAKIESDDDFRSIIAQLRTDIKKQNPLKVEIDNDKKGYYKLALLAL